MTEIVNLRQARKARARSEAEAKAARNRLTFGRSRKEREAGDAVRQVEVRRHEAHRLERPLPPDEPTDT